MKPERSAFGFCCFGFLCYVFTELVRLNTAGPFGDPFLDCQKGGKSNQRAALKPFGVSFSTIFLHEKKDGAPGGNSSIEKSQLRKHVKLKKVPR